MRLLPRWLWKRIPHRHLYEVTGGFILSPFHQSCMYECDRCGRERVDEFAGKVMMSFANSHEQIQPRLIRESLQPNEAGVYTVYRTYEYITYCQ